jgi:hypothetical protein
MAVISASIATAISGGVLLPIFNPTGPCRRAISSCERSNSARRLRRASLFGRAPAVHDLNLALSLWGYLSDSPPADQVSVRRELFVGVGNVHHYKEGRAIADMVPESTLRMSPETVASQSSTNWRSLTGYAQ